jgi:hypothetical protein
MAAHATTPWYRGMAQKNNGESEQQLKMHTVFENRIVLNFCGLIISLHVSLRVFLRLKGR